MNHATSSSTSRATHLSQVLHDNEEVVATKNEPVEIAFVVKVDVLPDRPALLPHVRILFGALVLDLESDQNHNDFNCRINNT